MIQNFVKSAAALLPIKTMKFLSAVLPLGKLQPNKLPEAKPLLDNYRGTLKRLNFLELAINTDHALTAGSLM